MKDLTKTEETVLISVWQLGDNAYGVNIKKYIRKMTGKTHMYSTLYATFDQLVRKGYMNKAFGEPTAVRGGKRKVYFTITDAGFHALKVAFENHRALWRGITEESFNRGITG